MDAVADPELLGFSPDGLERIREWAAAYVADGRLAGTLTMIARRGRVAFLDVRGHADRDARTPLQPDTLFRIFSMTKPATSVAAMMLVEDGRLRLDDAVADYIPALANLRVCADGTGADIGDTVPLARPLTIHDLMTHTAGFTYGFNAPDTALGRRYAEQRMDFFPQGSPLADWVEEVAELPLLHQPGERWTYSIATDVLGRVIEVVCGDTLDRVLRERILDPLGMVDTSFQVPETKVDRLATLYTLDPDGTSTPSDPAGRESMFVRPVSRHSGGGGLVSTARDYLCFLEMLRRGGELEGVRLLQPETVADMTRNHLPGDIASMGPAEFTRLRLTGVGFGLGFSVILNSREAGVPSPPGEYAWGGAASTAFFVAPSAELCVVFLTQLLPSDAYPLRRELRELVYGALPD